MMTACAAEGDRQVALPLANVVRKQIDQQFRDAADEFHGLREGPDITGHARMPAGQMLKPRNIVWIGQETHVEYQIAVRWHTMTVAETGHVDHDLRLLPLSSELFADEFPQ